MTTTDSKNPFKAKGVVLGPAFFNRKEEIDLLEKKALSGQHTLLLAPRRFGKTSLLQEVAKNLTSQGICVVNVDLFKCSTIHEFLSKLSKAIVKTQKGPVNKVLATIKKGLPKLAPKISVNALGEPEFSINFESEQMGFEELEELLLWFDRIDSGAKKLLILDEIQEIAIIDPSGKVEKYLRAIFQHFQNITVFFSGSLPSVLKEMFFDKKRAFYQSALRMDIGFTPLEEAQKYLTKHLKPVHGKAEELARYIVGVSKGHPYYVQLMGLCAWDFGTHATPEKILQAVLTQEQTTFENAITVLTHQQRQVFRAIASDPEQPVTSQGFLRKHSLPGHSSVKKAIQKLEALGYVLKTEKGYIGADPLLSLWWSTV